LATCRQSRHPAETGHDVIARFTSVEGDVASLSTQLTNLNDIYSTDAETAAAVAGLMTQLTNLGTADTDLYNTINGLAAAQRTAIGLTNDNQLPDLSGNVYLNGATSVIGGLTAVADALAALHTTLALSNLNGKSLEISTLPCPTGPTACSRPAPTSTRFTASSSKASSTRPAK